MNYRMLAGALLATFALSGFANEPALSDASADTAVLATFDDGPTGFRFVWRRDNGWTFAGMTPPEAVAVKASLAGSANAKSGEHAGDTPLAVFVDAVSGYQFEWTADAGWTFAGPSASLPAQLQAAR